MAMTLAFPGRLRGPVSLGTMTLGTAFATVGTAFECGGAQWIGAFIDLTINNGTNARFRLRAMHEAGGSAFQLPIQTVGSATVAVEDRLIEFAVDADQRQIVTWQTFGIVPWARLEAMTSGGTAAYLNAVEVFSAR